jgi:hypothetical protein
MSAETANSTRRQFETDKAFSRVKPPRNLSRMSANLDSLEGSGTAEEGSSLAFPGQRGPKSDVIDLTT